MRELNRVQSIVFMVGGMLMVMGAGCFAFMWQQKIVCWLFAFGAITFAVMQFMQTYNGQELVIKRLKKIQNLANILFVVSAILMIDSAYMFMKPLFTNASGTEYNNYIDYIYNKWVVLLILASILEVYTTHRLNSELNKSNK